MKGIYLDMCPAKAGNGTLRADATPSPAEAQDMSAPAVWLIRAEGLGVTCYPGVWVNPALHQHGCPLTQHLPNVLRLCLFTQETLPQGPRTPGHSQRLVPSLGQRVLQEEATQGLAEAAHSHLKLKSTFLPPPGGDNRLEVTLYLSREPVC